VSKQTTVILLPHEARILRLFLFSSLLFRIGIVVIFECTASRGFVRRMGPEILPAGDSIFYLRPDTVDPH